MESSYDEYTFAGRRQAPWVMSDSVDDLGPGVPAPDAFSHTNWEEWMRWDPSAAPASPKSHHAIPPGSVVTPAMAHGRMPINSNSTSASSNDGDSDIATTMASSAMHPAHASQAFMFSAPLDDKSPFAFDATGMMASSHHHLHHQPVTTISPTTIAMPAMSNHTLHHQLNLDPSQHGLMSPLTFDHQQAFAMGPPPPQSTPSLHHSPESSTDVKTTPSSQNSPVSQSPPNTGDHHGKKRKTSASEFSDDKADKDDKAPPPKKTAHNMIEKRYRTNLNEKIAALRDAVPSLRAMSKASGNNAEDDDAEDLEGLTPAHKLNKATVLSKATEYIHHLEKRCRRMQEEMNTLKSRLDTIEKYSMAGPMPMSMVSGVGTPTVRVQEDPFSSASAGPSIAAPNPPQGMIPVPRSMANLHRSAYHQRPDLAGGQVFTPYASGAMLPGAAQDQAQAMAVAQAHAQRPMHGQPMLNRRDGGANRFMNKLMVGSLAGLMLLEGFHEHEQSADTPSGRGLFAAPIQLLLRLGPKIPSNAVIGDISMFQRVLPLLKSLSILAAIVYLLMPVLTFNAKRSKRPLPLLRLAPAPSLASPIEVRRTAWLTAIQTVWVPQHNFLLEVAALTLKTLKLSTRKLIGWQGYALLTGITKEQEAARVKAWEIALDAQLTGGDAEISISRLVLTLMASGTLPDTPSRLMLKALHIRVLLWEVATAGYGGWFMFDELCLKIARSYWNSAQEEYRLSLLQGEDSNVTEPMPKHLAALLQLECDDVLIKSIVQRGYNLAWNRPSAEKARPDEAMDSVIEDFAISSPLDALAAWFSTHILGTALALYFDEATSGKEPVVDQLDLTWEERLQLAIDTAPPLTGAWTRALVAKAVLVDSNRGKNISQALEALPARPYLHASQDTPSSLPRTILMNAINQMPAAPDVQTALTFAKCLALADGGGASTSKARASAAHVINNYFISDNAFSTLSVVAAYKIVDSFADDDELFAMSRQGLERITMSIRMWIGGEGGGHCGVDSHTRGQIIERCLAISKKLVGMAEDANSEIDAGYHTQSDADIAVQAH